MKTQKYLKLIYEKGSVIFRDVTSYNKCEKNQLMIITFQDKSAVALDMMYLDACMGKLVNIKENIKDVKEGKCVDIIDTL